MTRLLPLLLSLASCNLVLDVPDRAVARNMLCEAGACTCVADFGDCDGDIESGCETSLRDNPGACGACGVRCESGVCSGDRCECPGAVKDCDGDAANGCETDTLQAPAHCGRCGHDCLGGSCAAGACQPLALLTRPGVWGLVKGGPRLYFLQGGATILGMPDTGGRPDIVFRGEPGASLGLSADERTIAVLSNDPFAGEGAVLAYDIASASMTTLFEGSLGQADRAVLAGDSVYFLKSKDEKCFPNPDPCPAELWRVPREGGSASLVDGDASTKLEPLLASDGEEPFWIRGTGVWTLRRGAPVLFVEAPDPFPQALVANAHDILLDSAVGVARYPRPAGSPDGPLDACVTSPITDGAAFLWMSCGPTFSVWEVDAAEPFDISYTSRYLSGIAADPLAIYWIDEIGVWKLAR